jgi:hypothetical protein
VGDLQDSAEQVRTLLPRLREVSERIIATYPEIDS